MHCISALMHALEDILNDTLVFGCRLFFEESERLLAFINIGFCPGYVQVLSKISSEAEQVLFRIYLGSLHELSRFSSGFLQVLSRICLSSVTDF